MALNAVVHFAIKEGYTYLLTMDQGSRFDSNMFLRYLDKISKYSANDTMAFVVNTQEGRCPI